MLTQCPGCQTVFRITGSILRAAHGQVRCGRCNTQFDAVQNAFDEEQLPPQMAAKQTRQEPSEKTEYMPPRQENSSADDVDAFMSSVFHQSAHNEQITMEGDRINPDEMDQKNHGFMVDEGLTDDSIIEIFNVDSAEWSAPFAGKPEKNGNEQTDAESVPQESPPAYVDEITRIRQQFFDEAPEEQPLFVQTQEESIEISRVVNDDAFTSADPDAEAFNESVYMTALENALKDPTGQPVESPQEGEPESILERTRLRRWSTTRSKKQPPPPDVLEPGQHVEPAAPKHWPLLLGCVGLSLLLVFQITHHYRRTLVRHPTFGPTLKSIYSIFGKNLEPRWEVNAYSIKQWGIVSDPQEPGVLRVRASVTNNAAFAQPYPLLKLTLEDRFGTHLGTRAFKPAEYLPGATSATRLLDAGTAANVDLAIVDPGEEAVGFQFDSCLGNDSEMHCAHE
ncbi:MAG: DUF3426 domain-containing protein [Steroidobacter sp.]